MKPLITANTIRAAAEAGQTSLTVVPGTIVSPAAKDEAKLRGITLDFSQDCAGAVCGATGQEAAALNNLDPGLIQKIVAEVLRQLAGGQNAVVADSSGLVHIRSGQKEFLPLTGEPRLKSKIILTQKEHQADAALMLLEAAATVPYRPQTAELALIIEGNLNCATESGEYTATPGEAFVLPAHKTFQLRAARQTIWFSLKLT